MVYVKMVRNTSGGTLYLKNLCNYVTRAKANDEDDVLGVGGYGINPWNADKAYRQMFAIKLYYNKLEKNPVIHFIISFDRLLKMQIRLADMQTGLRNTFGIVIRSCGLFMEKNASIHCIMSI